MLRLLIVLLWIPISTHARVHLIENQETRLELSEILAGMDSTESILLFSFGSATLVNFNYQDFFHYDHCEVRRNIGLLNQEYNIYKKNPYAHDPAHTYHVLRKLYTELIAPVSPLLHERIRIIADTSLSEIPWNVLQNKKGTYLVENYEIRLDSEFREVSSRSMLPRESIQALVIAPDFAGADAIENRVEQEGIDQLFQLTNSFSAELVHVCSHGMKEGIWISAKKNLLGIEDLRNQQLDSKLVFLNTCYSSGIAQAAVSSGSISAIGTLWQVDDHVALTVAKVFYSELVDGESVSTSLKTAMMQTRILQASEGMDHPFNWGVYQVYGAGKPIIQPGGYNYLKLFSIVFSFLTTFSFMTYHLGGKVRGKLVEYNLI